MNDIENDPEIESLEAQLPAASGVAFSNARAQVLASGQSVLQSEGGVIYEVFPDGHRLFVKTVEPPSTVIVGSKVILE
jgi:hypothetical protein